MALTITESSPLGPEAKALIDALSEHLGSRFGGDGRDSFRAAPESNPRSFLLVAWNGEDAVGCGAVQPLSHDVGEIKRMFAKYPRGGVGTQVLRALEAEALRRGYRALWLETRALNEEAISFYCRNGYVLRPNYGKYVGNPAAVCFEKELRDGSAGMEPK